MNVFQATAKLIETYFAQKWATLDAPPLGWWNVPFSQPANGLWAMASVRMGDGVQSSIGSNPLEKVVGFLAVQVFSPKAQGTRKALVVADQVANAVRYVQLTDGEVTVDFRAPRVTDAMELKDHYQTTVQLPFVAQHIT